MATPRRRDPRLPIPAGGGSIGFQYGDGLALPRVRFFGLVQMGPAWRQDPHRHEIHEIAYVRRGRGTLAMGERVWRTRAGDIYLLRPDEPHGGDTDPADPAQVLYVGIELPPRFAAEVDRRRGDLPFVIDDPALASALRELGDQVAARPAVDDPGLALAALAVLAALAPRVAPPRGGTPAQRRLADAALRALELADAPPTLARVARGLNVSAAHLGDALGASIGRTWPDLAAERRMQAVRALLADADVPVREIARRVGLSGPRALARLCRRLTGRSPAQLRDV